MSNQLPIVKIGDKSYYDDKRLREYRNIDNPHDRIDYDNTVICPHCKTVLTYLNFRDEGRYSIANKSEFEGLYDIERIFSCPKCYEEIEGSTLEEWGVV